MMTIRWAVCERIGQGWSSFVSSEVPTRPFWSMKKSLSRKVKAQV